MSSRNIKLATLLLCCFSLCNFCPAQTPFLGDFLPGQASGSFDTWQIAVGDFNGDGRPDVASVSLNEGTLNVFLGNGNGTFTGTFTYTFIQTFSPMSVVTADVNGDGKADLIVACYNTLNLALGGPVSVFFGNGDGTFQHEADYNGTTHSTAVVAADFNGDGAIDLAATDNGAGTIEILLNHGDGTFQSPVSYAASIGPYSLVVGDFNWDGNADLAVTNCQVAPNGNPIECGGSAAVGTVSVLLGKGDGTFQAAKNYTAGVNPHAIAAATLRSGGNTSLLVTDTNNGSLLVLAGNGDGTFQSAVNYPGDGGHYVAVADFNGDGKLDVVTSGQTNLVEYLGNGDGSLQPAVDYYRTPSGYPYWWLAADDFNGDGHTDIAVSYNATFSAFLNAAGTSRQASITSLQTVDHGCGNITVSTTVVAGKQVPAGAVTLQVDNQYFAAAQFGSLVTGVASVDIFLPPGTHTITAVYSGDSLTLASSSAPSTLTLQGQSSLTTLISSPNPSLVGQAVSFTASITPSDNSPNCVSGLVTFLDGATFLSSVPLNQVASVASVASVQAVFTTRSLAAGSHSITASYGGAPYVSPSTSPTLVETVDNPSMAVFTPATLAFPNTLVGQTSSTQQVTLTNTGGATLTIGAVSASIADFGVVSTCGGSLAAGASCSIGVFFDPTVSGARSGQLVITDSAVGSPQSLPLSGSGQSFSVAPSSQTTATVAPGQTANYTISIAPGGGFSQTVALSCGVGPAGSICSVSPGSVTLSGASPSTATVTVATTGNSAGLEYPKSGPPTRLPFGSWSGLSDTLRLAMLFSFSAYRRTRRRSLLYGLAFLSFLVAAFTFTACGGGSTHTTPATPAGTYDVTVSATFSSGTAHLNQSTTLKLVVE